MKQLFMLMVVALLLAGTATATTFRITNIGSATPFQGGMTNIHYNSGSGTQFGFYQDNFHARAAFSGSQGTFQTAWHNPQTLVYGGNSYNTAHRSIQPLPRDQGGGWQMQSAQVRTNSFGMHVQQSPWDGSYFGQGRIGTAPSPVWPTAYRQPTPVHNPWGVHSNHYGHAHSHFRTPTAYVRPTNYW